MNGRVQWSVKSLRVGNQIVVTLRPFDDGSRGAVL